jgi:ATP-dependent Lon protease
MCRKPVLMNKDSLNKNVTFENIIRSKFAERYDEKVKTNRLAYSQDGEGDVKRTSLPTVVINDVYIWPRTKKTLTIQDKTLEPTLTLATVNDRYLVVAPNADFENDIACLVEIVKLESTEHVIKIEIKGLKRFKIKEFRHVNVSQLDNIIYLSNGEVVRDLDIESEDLKTDIIDKIKYCEKIHKEILEKAPSTISRKLENLYGPIPTLTGQLTSGDLENITLYYLNCVKADNKKQLYSKINIVERVDW